MKKIFAPVAFFGVIGLLTSQASVLAQQPQTRATSVTEAKQAETSAADSDPALRKFGLDYYGAVTHHDPAKLRSLIYPPSLACIDAVSAVYFEQELSLFPRNVTTSAPTLITLDPARARAMASAVGAKLPADAGSFITIDWKEASGGETNNHPNLLAVKKENGRYFEVIACPSAEDIRARNAFFARQRNPKP